MIGRHTPFDQPWVLQQILIPNPGSGNNIIYKCPPGQRCLITSVDGFLSVPGLGTNSRVQVHIERGSHQRNYVLTHLTFLINNIWEFHFSLLHHAGIQLKTEHIHVASLAAEMWMEEDDELHIERITSSGQDRFEDVSVTVKSFRLADPPNRLRNFIDAFTR